MTTYKSFADALTAAPSAPKAANDNKPVRKRKETRYRGTLPALRWLYDNHPDLAEPVADAVQSLEKSNWNPEAGDDYLEIRPSISELVRAASDGTSDDGKPNWLSPTIETDKDGNSYIQLGALKFVRGALEEYGRTARDAKLAPRDRARDRVDAATETRDPHRYVLHTKATTPSPLRAEPCQRPFSGEPALAPMYDPQRGVEANRAILRSFGVDGSVAFEDLPFPATKCPVAIAKGAEFLGGVASPSGNSSSGAVNMGEVPEPPKGEVRRVVEEIASGATLKDIGERMGMDMARPDRAAKELIVGAARVLVASNDNSRKKNAA
jgi:hypothetical protein